MTLKEFDHYYIDPIHEKYAWRLCDFCVINDQRLRRYFPKTLEQNLSPDLSKYFVERKVREFQDEQEFLFVMKEKESHTLIGIIFVKELDWNLRQAELAYAIGYQLEGKGYMTEAVGAISNWAFEALQLKTLRILVHHSNIASIRVAEKCGYLWKGILKGAHTPPGEPPLDMQLYERHA